MGLKLKKKPKKRSLGRKKSKTLPKGDALLNHVIKLTGLPHKTLKHELKEILGKKNINSRNLNLGQLRCAAASYVREIMLSLVDKCAMKKSDPVH